MNHLSLDELGDVDTAREHPHLARCGQCREVLAEQLAVRDLLGALPAPTAAPPDVVLALERALAAAGPAAAGRPGRPEPRPADDPPMTLVQLGRPVAPARRGRRALAAGGRLVLALAASAAVVLAGIEVVHDSGGASDSAASSSAGGSARAMEESPDSSPEDSPGSATRATPGHEQGSATAAGSPVALARTGTRYTRAAITTQAQGLLRRGTATSGQSLAQPPGSAELRACLTVIRPGLVTVAADVATFEGRPAVVLVVSLPSGREVWVVPRDCRAADAATVFRGRLP